MRRLLAAALLALAACQAPFERRPSEIDGPRFLAVRSEPPEAAPGTQVSLTALMVEPAGPVAALAPSWAFCVVDRPAAEDNTVSSRCVAADAPELLPFPGGADPLTATAALPAEGCQVFGSEPPPPPPGEPPQRPADPDSTGGYYQPVRVGWPGEGPVAFGQVRLSCALPAAPLEVARDFRARYRANQNPALAELELLGGAVAAAPGERLSLFAAWSAGAAEPFVVYDQASASLVDRVEALRVSWFATAGALDADVTREVSAGGAEVGWVAPAEPGTVHLWAVLRDDRGGAGWRHLAVEVR